MAAFRLLLLVSAFGFFSTACRWVIVPKGEPAERAKAAAAERIFAIPVEKRPLPDLATSAGLPTVLEYAFNASGDIEMAYREWRAAIEQIPQAGALADPRLQFRAIFSSGGIKDFGARIAVSQEFPAPGKRQARAEMALREAQAAGERFRAAKFMLQRRAIQAYADLALNEAVLRLTSETFRLLQESHEVALHRFHALDEKSPSEDLTDLRKIEIEIQTVESEQRSLQFMHAKLAATLNGILNRPADAPFGQLRLPAIQRPAESPEDLFARAVEANPELAAQRREVEARGSAQVLAELEKRPDYMIAPMLEYAGGMFSPMLDTAITLPVNRARIRAGIVEALARRQAAQARLRSASSDVQARVVIALAGMGDAERVLEDYGARIVPKARELLQTQITTYGSGSGNLLDILDTERLLVDFRKMILQAQSDRLRYLADLEEVLGEDLFHFTSDLSDPSGSSDASDRKQP